MKFFDKETKVKEHYLHNVKQITMTFKRIVEREPTRKEHKQISNISLEFALITFNTDKENDEQKKSMD